MPSFYVDNKMLKKRAFLRNKKHCARCVSLFFMAPLRCVYIGRHYKQKSTMVKHFSRQHIITLIISLFYMLGTTATEKYPLTKQLVWKDHVGGQLEELDAGYRWTPADIIKSYLGHCTARVTTLEPWMSHDHASEFERINSKKDPKLFLSLQTIAQKPFSHTTSIDCIIEDDEQKEEEGILLTHIHIHEEKFHSLAYIFSLANPNYRPKIFQSPKSVAPRDYQQKNTQLAKQLFFGDEMPENIESSFFPEQEVLVVHDQMNTSIWQTTTQKKELQRTLKEDLPACFSTNGCSLQIGMQQSA